MNMMTAELTSFAAEQQRRFDGSVSAFDRKTRGHFGTPAVIAEFMARMFSELPQGIVRILDPGAGVGTLSAAVCQHAIKHREPCNLDFEIVGK